MPDFPSPLPYFVPFGSINSFGETSFLGDEDILNRTAFSTGQLGGGLKASAISFLIDVPVTIYRILWENGPTLAGNIDVGIYNADGSRIISSGSVAQAGASSIQSFDITDTRLRPGEYFMALANDSSSATFLRSNKTGYAGYTGGFYQAVSSFPLPDPIVFDTPTSTIPTLGMPAMSLALRSEMS